MEVNQRARFEEWMKNSHPDRDLERWPDGKYAWQFSVFAWEVWQAAMVPPDDYVLVPRVPTPEMQDAVESMKLPHALLRTGVRLADFRERYAAMLVARPLVNRSEMEP